MDVAYLEGFPTSVIRQSRAAKKVAFVHTDFSKGNAFLRYYSTQENGLSEYRKYDNVVFVSQGVEAGFRESVGDISNSLVLSNVFDFKDIVEKSKEDFCGYKSDRFKIVFVGRISKEKRLDRLIKAVSKIQDTYPLDVIVLGDGELRHEAEILAQQLEVTCISFKGFVTNPYPYMAQANLLVCTSEYEGYSSVVVEALALGTPVLSTRCAGMEEIFDSSDCGIIIDNTDEAVYEELEKILSNRCRYSKMKEAAENRSVSLIADDNAQMYNNLFIS